MPKQDHLIAVISRIERDIQTLKGALLVGAEDWARGPVIVITELVAEHYKLPVMTIIGRSRVGPYVFARHVAIYLARSLTKFSNHDIGRCFKLDPGAVIHAVRRIKNDMDLNPEVVSQIDYLLKEGRARIDRMRNNLRDLPLFQKSIPKAS